VSIIPEGENLYKEDHILIDEILNGTLSSYDTLMERYQNLIFKIAYSFGKNKENAMDISQNIFLKAYQKLGTLKGQNSFKAWLSRIAYHEGINWTRKHKSAVQFESIETSNEPESNLPSKEDELLANEYRHELMQSLFALNTKYRLAVVLRYYQNMSIREIAGILKCSEGMVKNMLFRSLQRLKIILQKNQSEVYYG
jgi:RNA polymerase sigma-70 factor (ECF subfamily)